MKSIFSFKRVIPTLAACRLSPAGISSDKMPVVFDHALFFGADLWLLKPEGSTAKLLPLMLADDGYDVW